MLDAMKLPMPFCAALLLLCARLLPAETVVNVAANGLSLIHI